VALSATAAEAESFFAPEFNPDSFVRTVDNRFFPLVPGTQFVYKGEEDEESETNVTLVTKERKRILGISAVVVVTGCSWTGSSRRRPSTGTPRTPGGMSGTWGRTPGSSKMGRWQADGSWEAGVKGAKAGIIMPAHPAVGQHYRQEFFAGEAEDEAMVVDRGLDITVPYGSFHNCIKTVEWTRLEPGIKEAKFYCPRVGFVKANDVQGPETRLVLRHIVH
jgi:hypothetical protein